MTTLRPRPALPIRLSRASGTGPTALAAFDAALRGAGTANFNLVRLSSVIPPASTVAVLDRPLVPRGEWGDKLFVVYAEWRAEEPGDEAWAGIGWLQDPATGRGVFVEHEGPAEDGVRDDIAASLEALRAGRPEVDFGPRHTVVQGATCRDEPVCALVIAVYEADTWRRDGGTADEDACGCAR
jgi:arginine decarboxylase